MKREKEWYVKTEIVYIFLLPLFFLLHAYNEYFALIPLKVLLGLGVYYCLVTATIIFFSVLLLQKPAKAVVFSFFLLSLFFFFGAVHDFLKTIIPVPFFVSYTFLLPLIFIIVAGGFIICKKKIGIPLKLVNYIRYLLLLLFFIEVLTLCYNILENRGKNNDLTRGGNVWEGSLNAGNRPDIFFVVLDGYTSSKCLKTEFNFDNYEMDSLLKANGFFISENSQSNYNATPYSLSSTMDGNYLKPELAKKLPDNKNFLQAIETFKNNKLVQFLGKEGYRIKNYGCFDLRGAPAAVPPYFEDLYKREIDDETFYSRLMRDIGWNFQLKNIFTGSFRIPESYKKNKALHLYRNQYNWSRLLEELQSRADQPRFVYAHIMIPHEPYFIDANGKDLSDTGILLRRADPKQGYLGQVKYCNNLLKGFIPLAVSKSDRNRVVIVEGDHGFREYADKVDKGKEFMNLNAFYFSDRDYRNVYDGMSPVNTFRAVFNKYFQYQLPLLKDSSFNVHLN